MGELILGVYDSDTYLVVTTDGILLPLGVNVIGDSRHAMMPETRDITETVPGWDGEYDFGTEFGNRPLELHVSTEDGMTAAQKMALRRTIMAYINPASGYKRLIFMDDPDVYYEVKVSGTMTMTNHPTWFEFTIPFKAKPYVKSYVENSLAGTGTAVNAGTVNTPVFIDILGPASSPTVSVGTQVIAYNEEISSGETLYIDGQAKTVVLSGVNSLKYFSGTFPKLVPGSSAVLPSVSSVTLRWRDWWI